ncbi:MAG: TatD family hydrolase [Planctomycetales bacterium]|nr:TatD family hydrolase [Planctomycetales bacterium]
MPQFFDTHAHLDSEEFDADRLAFLQRAAEAGVADVLCVGTTAESSRKCLAIASGAGAPGCRVHAAVGIQPNYCHEVEGGDWDAIVAMATSGQAVALGETGLDGYWDFCPLDVQRDYFDRHLQLSQQLELPFIVHQRDSMTPILEMLREARSRGPLRGVMHSFTGTASEAKECIELGLHISFAGMVTFKKSDSLRAVAVGVPADRLLIETDAPYLSPEPLRGKRPNEPARVVHTAACLADARGEPLERFAEQTRANAASLFLREAA